MRVCEGRYILPPLTAVARMDAWLPFALLSGLFCLVGLLSGYPVPPQRQQHLGAGKSNQAPDSEAGQEYGSTPRACACQVLPRGSGL